MSIIRAAKSALDHARRSGARGLCRLASFILRRSSDLPGFLGMTSALEFGNRCISRDRRGHGAERNSDILSRSGGETRDDQRDRPAGRLAHITGTWPERAELK
jgi:hypothetical protein